MEDLQKQSVGAVIRTLREAQGLTRRDLVDRSSQEPSERVSLEMLAKVEQGKKAPSARTLRKLAAGLGVEPMDLSSRAAKWEAGLAAGASVPILRSETITFALAKATPSAAKTGGAAAAAGLILPVVGPALVGLAGAELYERRKWASLLEARLAQVLSSGSVEEIQEALATLDQILPEAPSH